MRPSKPSEKFSRGIYTSSRESHSLAGARQENGMRQDRVSYPAIEGGSAHRVR